uniref:Galactokinase N-terminal domain-containing protein n=1 Tax=Fundulus heteroclitus TaxID=8078 RepID=A0A3Q2QHB9_FUNHE
FFYHRFASIDRLYIHIDYCGYSVLPMAIEQSILTAVSVNNSGMIQMANTNPQYQ